MPTGGQRVRWRQGGLLAGVLSALALAAIEPSGQAMVAGMQGLALLLSVVAWQALRPLHGGLIARHGQVWWCHPATACVIPQGVCQITTCQPGAIGVRLGPGRAWRWIFQDEMTAQDWRRLHVLARFANQNGVRSAR